MPLVLCRVTAVVKRRRLTTSFCGTILSSQELASDARNHPRSLQMHVRASRLGTRDRSLSYVKSPWTDLSMPRSLLVQSMIQHGSQSQSCTSPPWSFNDKGVARACLQLTGPSLCEQSMLCGELNMVTCISETYLTILGAPREDSRSTCPVSGVSLKAPSAVMSFLAGQVVVSKNVLTLRT